MALMNKEFDNEKKKKTTLLLEQCMLQVKHEMD
jgi:hypothetical protein